MSIVITNNLLRTNQNSTDTQPESNKKFTRLPTIYFGNGFTNVPGLTYLYSAPVELYQSVKATIKAVKIGDKEGIFENISRSAQIPLNFASALGQTSWYLLEAAQKIKLLSNSFIPIIAILSKCVTALGLAICAIEGALEGAGLYRSIRFLNHRSQKTDNLKFTTDLRDHYFTVSKTRMGKIEEYVQKNLSHLSPNEQKERKEAIVQENLFKRESTLARRVQPWLAKEIEETLPGIITNLQSDVASKRDQAAIKTDALYKQVKIQAQKKLLVHSLGILAVLTTLAGLMCSLIACPLLVPILLLVIAGVASIARYAVHAGYLDSKGWNFDAGNCIPQFVKNLYHKIFTEKVKPMVQGPLYSPSQLHFMDFTPSHGINGTRDISVPLLNCRADRRVHRTFAALTRDHHHIFPTGHPRGLRSDLRSS